MKTTFKTVQQEAYDAGSASFFNRNLKNPFSKSVELSAEWQRGYDHAELSDKRHEAYETSMGRFAK